MMDKLPYLFLNPWGVLLCLIFAVSYALFSRTHKRLGKVFTVLWILMLLSILSILCLGAMWILYAYRIKPTSGSLTGLIVWFSLIPLLIFFICRAVCSLYRYPESVEKACSENSDTCSQRGKRVLWGIVILLVGISLFWQTTVDLFLVFLIFFMISCRNELVFLKEELKTISLPYWILSGLLLAVTMMFAVLPIMKGIQILICIILCSLYLKRKMYLQKGGLYRQELMFMALYCIPVAFMPIFIHLYKQAKIPVSGKSGS